ncbi:MAG: hypothetical protein QXT25_04365 [Candidatus Anstonellaceae archaeon]
MGIFKKRQQEELAHRHSGKIGKDEIKFLNAEHMLKEFCRQNGLRHPLELLMQPVQSRDELLLQYCKQAIAAGHSQLEIAQALAKWGYAKKIFTHKPTNADQAAGAYLFASTSKVDWLELLFGGQRIVEDGKLLNGVFGRATTNHLDSTDVKAAALYLSSHDLEHDLPQAPMIMFGGRCSSHKGKLDAERLEVTQDRDEFEKSLGNKIVGKHFFKISDPKHDSTLKFRICCVVWDEKQGKLFVVSDKTTKPTPFCEWVNQNLNEILSVSDEQLEQISNYVKEMQLVEKMRVGEGRPWSELLSDVKSRKGIFQPAKSEGDYYRQAVKIWRFALLQLTAQNVQEYEKRWATIKEIQEIANAQLKLVCDDGRQDGNVKVLGAILKQEEFEKMFGDYNRQLGCLFFVPHYACGFLTAAQSIHDMIERLKLSISLDEADEFERKRKLEFFASRFSLMASDKTHSPVAEWQVLRDYLPRQLAEDLSKLMKGRQDVQNRDFVAGLYTLFCDSSAAGEKLRSVAARALDVEVFKIDEDGFLHMPAATLTYQRLSILFGQDFRLIFSADQINALITEEVARQAHKRYQEWASKLGFKIEFGMENFKTGQITQVPPAPSTPSEALDMKRKDLFISTKFTQEEIEILGLEKFGFWEIPTSYKR